MGKAEGYVEDYLIKQAKAHNHLCFKFISPGIDGVPDRILIGNGKTIFIECNVTLDDHTYPVWDPDSDTPKTDAMYCIAEHRKESYYAN